MRLATIRSRRGAEVPPLGEFVHQTSPLFDAPRHLAPLIERITEAFAPRAGGEPQPLRLVVAAPPRHGKTELLLHAVAWALRHDATRLHGYVTYADALARSKSRRARQFAVSSGVRFPSQGGGRLNEWRTSAGGGMLATGVGGPLTGQGISGMLIVDDPVKNRVEAESTMLRERHWQWFNEVAFTRLEPGASVVVCMTRWHPDDLAGRLVADGWEYLNLRAVGLDGAALWPERWGLPALDEIKEQVGEYGWSALYQGDPRHRGGEVFSGVTTFCRSPEVHRLCIGLDLAYTASTRADYSVAVLLTEEAGRFYVLDVLRAQEDVTTFARRVRALRSSFTVPPPVCWYTGGTEKGVAALLRAEGLPVRDVPAKGDKFVRAQPVAAAWKAGNVLVPEQGASWLDAFVGEVLGFTGVGDTHDDQVDALAAAFDHLVPATRTSANSGKVLDFGAGLHRDTDLL